MNCLSKSKSFGLVSLIHVLEHLPDPVSYLRRLRQDYLIRKRLPARRSTEFICP
jgi:2-polyprenyl-3-methyl-5-hydroxy-6-metoxy-1,4-benzoquinol methylase